MSVNIKNHDFLFCCFFSLAQIFYLAPSGLSFIPGFDDYAIVFNVFLTVSSFIIVIIKKIKITPILVAFYLFLGTAIVSAILNQNISLTNAWSIVIISTGLLLVECGLQIDFELFLYNTYKLYYLFIIINVVTMIIFPNGITINFAYYFLGNYDSQIQYLLIGLISGYLYYYFSYGFPKLSWYLLWILGYISYMIHFSATSFVSLSIIMLFMIFFHSKGVTKFIFCLRNYIIINGFLFYGFVFNHIPNIVQKFITKVLHKSLTFSSRRGVWERALKSIGENFLYGVGLQDDQTMMNAVGRMNCHNMYLEILYHEGIIGLVLIVLAIGIFNYKIKKNDQQIIPFFEITIGAVLLIFQFQVLKVQFLFFILVVFYFSIQKIKEQEKYSINGKKR